MHQMHLRKILEWEEHLAALEGQIQQLSEEQQQIQMQIQQQIQQLWMHQSASNATTPQPFVFVNAVNVAKDEAEG